MDIFFIYKSDPHYDIINDSLSDSQDTIIGDSLSESSSNEINTQNTYYIDSTNHPILLSNYGELHDYIKNNTTYDGIYYYFYMDKKKHKVTFKLRNYDLLTETICKYHVIINIKT